jgi:methionine sulfoxide reductase heme-binding subunit
MHPLQHLVKPVVFLLCAVPLVRLAVDLLDGTLAANPMPEVIRVTGVWSLRLMVIGLVLSPLRDLTGWSAFTAPRRMLGLYAALYAGIHLLAWARYYDYDWLFLLDEILVVPFLAIGTVAALMLVPMVATSHSLLHGALGAAVWGRIHALIYPTVILVYIHDVMARRFHPVETLVIGIAITVLIALRLRRLWRRRISVGAT